MALPTMTDGADNVRHVHARTHGEHVGGCDDEDAKGVGDDGGDVVDVDGGDGGTDDDGVA